MCFLLLLFFFFFLFFDLPVSFDPFWTAGLDADDGTVI